ncbi:GumC family protein [Novosphingobium resinovorum]|uniref:GumC family protein n=1 Tax=Novosphingobium resinovorum TaxID=158500 RepID=UPI002ED4B4C4|nr:polysaccharide biosynthesis tyrosine autokinase [Novosphingobium resinovorum]
MKDIAFGKDAPDEILGKQETEFDFSRYLKTFIGVVRRNAVVIGVILAGSILLGVIVTLLMTPTYDAVAQIMIEDQADEIIEGSELQSAMTGRGDTARFLSTQLGIVQSRSLARAVIQSERLDRNPAYFEAMGSEMPVAEAGQSAQDVANASRNRAISLLQSALSVEMPIDSRIAGLSIRSRSPQLSARLANLYAQRYIEYNLNQKYESSAYARRFLADQLDDARNKLTQSERDLNQYARAAGLIRVTGQGGNGETALSVTNNTLVDLNSSASKAIADRIAAEDRWKTIAGQPILNVPEVNANPAVSGLIAEKAKAQAILADELSRHRDGYSTVVAQRAAIAELDRRILAIATSIKNSAQLDYQAAAEKEKSLLSRVTSVRGEALDEQDRGVQYSVLKRVADTNRTLYETLLSRYNQLNASAGATSNNVTLVDAAEVPHSPHSPNLLLNLAVALVAGFVLAAAIVFLKELFDDAIRSPEDVERKLEMPLLGLVPMLDIEGVEEEMGNRRSSLSEAFQSLVTNLRYSTANGLPRVLALTSSRESEGKSTTARSIALNVARLGNKVLLVDADLRRPTLHRQMKDANLSGLTDVLTGQRTLEEVAMPSGQPNLDYVSGLPMPPDPALILAGNGLPAFIADARTRYDMVVLDCPPLLGLSDAALLARHADGVLFIIDASSFHRGAVKSAMRRLALVKANILGVVLNRFNPRAGADDYKYYSYNYYSYGSQERD